MLKITFCFLIIASAKFLAEASIPDKRATTQIFKKNHEIADSQYNTDLWLINLRQRHVGINTVYKKTDYKNFLDDGGRKLKCRLTHDGIEWRWYETVAMDFAEVLDNQQVTRTVVGMEPGLEPENPDFLYFAVPGQSATPAHMGGTINPCPAPPA